MLHFYVFKTTNLLLPGDLDQIKGLIEKKSAVFQVVLLMSTLISYFDCVSSALNNNNNVHANRDDF